MNKRLMILAALVVAALSVSLAASSALAASPVYNAIPSPLPPNVASVGYEATSTSEFGDSVHLSTTNADRRLNTVTVTMSDWALHSTYPSVGNSAGWTHPITLNVYNVGSGNTPGALIKSGTQTFAIPYRPSADAVKCTNPGTDSNGGNDLGKWYSAADNTSFIARRDDDHAVGCCAKLRRSY